MIFFVPQFENLFDDLRAARRIAGGDRLVLGTSHAFMQRSGLWIL